jgi:hypothetical protein
MVMDHCAFVPVVNRPDLLDNVVAATGALHGDFTIIDNSPDGWVIEPPGPVRVFRPPVPLSFAQTMNWMTQETIRRGKDLCVFMHDDAVIPEHACEYLLEYVRDLAPKRPRWGVVFTCYDVLAAFNPVAFQEIGGFDTCLPQYFSDNDCYRRLQLAGWEKIDSGIQVGHVGSQTINSDAYLRHVNGVTFPLHQQYYRAKWGGDPGEEAFIHPFGILPREWLLARQTR